MGDIYLIGDIEFDSILPIINGLDRNTEEKYTLYLQTDGGDVFSALFFRNWLKNNTQIEKIICVGDVISGGVLILCGLHHIQRIAYPYITFGIHGLILSQGKAMVSYFEQMEYGRKSEILNTTIMDIYKNTLKLDDLLSARLTSGGTYFFDPQKAKELGLIDKVLPIKDFI